MTNKNDCRTRTAQQQFPLLVFWRKQIICRTNIPVTRIVHRVVTGYLYIYVVAVFSANMRF